MGDQSYEVNRTDDGKLVLRDTSGSGQSPFDGTKTTGLTPQENADLNKAIDDLGKNQNPLTGSYTIVDPLTGNKLGGTYISQSDINILNDKTGSNITTAALNSIPTSKGTFISGVIPVTVPKNDFFSNLKNAAKNALDFITGHDRDNNTSDRPPKGDPIVSRDWDQITALCKAA